MKTKIEPSLRMVWDMKDETARATERMTVADALRHMKREAEVVPGLNRRAANRPPAPSRLVADRGDQTYSPRIRKNTDK